jgi:hypothetical protein
MIASLLFSFEDMGGTLQIWNIQGTTLTINNGANKEIVWTSDNTAYYYTGSFWWALYFTNDIVKISQITSSGTPTEQIISSATPIYETTWTGNLQSIEPSRELPITPNYFVSNICFPAGTPVTTDQGTISIEKIRERHTILNKRVVGVSCTVSDDKYLICFKKDALGKNIPSKPTVCSKNHCIFYKGKMWKAKMFSGFEKVIKIKYTGEVLYNVLLEKPGKMIINNMICETLHPKNDIAKLINKLTVNIKLSKLNFR